jgi:hypothetical protein
MKKIMKIASVLAGFALALAGTYLAAYWNDLRTAQFQDQSPGMVAGGEMFLCIGVFAFLSVFPIGLALFFLRSEEKFWNPLSNFAVGLALTGPIAKVYLVLVKIFTFYTHSWLAFISFFALLRVMGTGIFLLGFVLFAFITPLKEPRKRLLIAAGIEMFLFLYSAVHFLILRNF